MNSHQGSTKLVTSSVIAFVLFLGLVLRNMGVSCVPASVDHVATEPLDGTVDPFQRDLEPDAMAPYRLKKKDFDLLLHPVAEYRISGLVLSKFEYYVSARSSTAPVDLAIGWGELSDPIVAETVDFKSERNGFYFYRVRSGSLVDMTYIRRHSANQHTIPATVNIERALKTIDRGDMVSIEGYLVDIDGTKRGKPWQWKTSRTRDDTMGGACEVVYVESLRVGDNVYH